MFKKICIGILILGGMLLSLKGLFSFDALAWICGGAVTVAARIGYVLFGLAALGTLVSGLREKMKYRPEK